jgi:predicted outer membrane repeat protein
MGDFGRFLALLGLGFTVAACGVTTYRASATIPPDSGQTKSRSAAAAPAGPQTMTSAPAPSRTPAATASPSRSRAGSPPTTIRRQLPRYGNPNGHSYVPPAGRAVSTAHPNHVIGRGTPASCTSAAVVRTVAKGGIITFNCGPKPVTIRMTATAKVVHGRRIVIDGGGKVTLSGGGKIRILYMNTCKDCWEQAGPKLIVQNMRFVAGNSGVHQTSTSSDYGGGAIFDQGGQLKVVNSAFIENRCYKYGPDLGGGAIRAYGMDMKTPVYITNDTFRGNKCSNGGALSALYANFVVINSLFTTNKAIGWGKNPTQPGTQGGGSGGGIYTDGDSYNLIIAGTLFHYNYAREGGGGIFCVVNNDDGTLRIKYSTLHRNPSGQFENAPGIFDSRNGHDVQPVVIHSTIN